MVEHLSQISISGSNFTKKECIYTIFIRNNKSIYLYIGQTGSQKGVRAPFYRFFNHFNDSGWANDNRVYRSIIKKVLELEPSTKPNTFDLNIKEEVEKFLCKCDICLDTYTLFKNNNVDNVKNIEKHLIEYYSKGNKNIKLLNTKEYKIETLNFELEQELCQLKSIINKKITLHNNI